MFLRSRAFQVLFLLTLYIVLAPYIPLELNRFFYTLSLMIKECLIIIMPITVCFFVASTLSTLQKKAPIFLIVVAVFELFSNLMSVWYAFGCGHLISQFLPPLFLGESLQTLEPLWLITWGKPDFWSADKGMLVGIVLGFFSAILKNNLSLKRVIVQGRDTVQWILTHVFSRLIPLFVLGFVAQLSVSGLLSNVFLQYGRLVVFLIMALIVYIVALFFIGSGGSLRKTFGHMRHILPATGMSLTTGCSLSTMPITIMSVMKMLKSPELAKVLIPTTTNVQQIGDCFIISFLSLLLYQQFYGNLPSFALWAEFSIFFAFARFATSAILGGAIFVVLPLIQQYFHFNSDMTAILLAFNVLLDPLVTSSNVTANGALCCIFEKVWDKVHPFLSKMVDGFFHSLSKRGQP